MSRKNVRGQAPKTPASVARLCSDFNETERCHLPRAGPRRSRATFLGNPSKFQGRPGGHGGRAFNPFFPSPPSGMIRPPPRVQPRPVRPRVARYRETSTPQTSSARRHKTRCSPSFSGKTPNTAQAGLTRHHGARSAELVAGLRRAFGPRQFSTTANSSPSAERGSGPPLRWAEANNAGKPAVVIADATPATSGK